MGYLSHLDSKKPRMGRYGNKRDLKMVQIEAFRGLRYDLGHVGSLSDVIAPPYDVIDAELQDQLYKNFHSTQVGSG